MSVKNDVNLPSKSSKQKYLENNLQKEQDPDPLVRGTDPQIRTHTKMSRIWTVDIQSSTSNGKMH